MNKQSVQAIVIGLSAIILPMTGHAEKAQYTCSYTEASYTAPFIKSPNIRNCPEGKCSYSVHINDDTAIVNGVSGFSVEQTEAQLVLRRSAKDPVMGGLDTTEFVLNKTDMSFTNVKTTTPSVVLTTNGVCQ